MNEDMIELLACPGDQTAPLVLHGAVRAGRRIQEGELVCPTCKGRFLIVAGIPRFLTADEEPSGDLKRREIEVRDAASRQRRSYELPPERFPEIDALRSAVGDCAGLRALDAGCGVGLMTPAVAAASRVMALDFSWQGLLKFRCPNGATVELIHGDVCRLPFRQEAFDVAMSSQVLEHMPSKELRRGFLAELHRTLKAGGRLVITTYNWDRARRQTGVPKEGVHRNVIFYYCYEPEEFRDELAREFEVEAIWGIRVLLPRTYRLVAALGKNSIYWDRVWRRTPLAQVYGKLLLAIGRHRSWGPRP